MRTCADALTVRAASITWLRNCLTFAATAYPMRVCSPIPWPGWPASRRRRWMELRATFSGCRRSWTSSASSISACRSTCRCGCGNSSATATPASKRAITACFPATIATWRRLPTCSNSCWRWPTDWRLQGEVTHQEIPDDPTSESERRQPFFFSAAGVPAFYVHRESRNQFLRALLLNCKKTRPSRRHPGYFRISIRDYRRALLAYIQQTAGDLVEAMNMQCHPGRSGCALQRPAAGSQPSPVGTACWAIRQKTQCASKLANSIAWRKISIAKSYVANICARR